MYYICIVLYDMGWRPKSEINQNRYADGRVFDDHVRQHSFVEIGHEIFSTAVLSLPSIQDSVTDERN